MRQLLVSGIAASVLGLAWTMLLFSNVRPKILHFSQAVAGVLLVAHAVILFVASSWVLAVLVTLIGALLPVVPPLPRASRVTFSVARWTLTR